MTPGSSKFEIVTKKKPCFSKFYKFNENISENYECYVLYTCSFEKKKFKNLETNVTKFSE